MSARLDRQQAFSGTREVPAELAFDPKLLQDFLARTIPGFAGPMSVRQFKGGQSNPTYLIGTPDRRYVIRRKPPGELLPSAHAVDREFRVIAALAERGFPVPRPMIYSEDASIVGTAFYVMDFVEGRVFWDPAMPDAEPAERTAVYDSMNETLATLHAFEPERLGLQGLGRPGNYIGRQVRRWSESYAASRSEELPEMDRLMAWLPDNLPPERPARLVHGDFRLDNMIVAPDRPQVVAVLDWELATLGDSIADAVYHFMTWVMPQSEVGSGTGSLAGLDLDALGIPSLDRYAATYARRSGLVEIPHLATYLAYNLFRLAAILQGIAGRARAGNAASPHAAHIAAQVGPLARAGWAFAQRGGL